MYRKINSIINIKSFAIVDEILYLSDSKIVSQYFYDGNREILISEKELQNLKTTNNSVFVNTINGIGFMIKQLDSICLNYPAQHIYYPYFLSYKRIDERKYSIIRNIEDIGYEKIIENSSTVFYIFRDNYFRWNPQNKHIEEYGFPSAQPLWQFDLGVMGSYYDSFRNEEKTYQVSKFLGVWQNKLLVALQEHKILMFDISSGELLRTWNTIDGLYFDDAVKDLIPKASSFVLSNGKLLGALHKFYFEIDLNTGNTQFTDLSATMNEHGILSVYPVLDNPLDGNYFYLTAKMKDQDKGPEWSYDCLFALNIETQKIDWKQTFEDAALGVNRPQYSNGKLYQLDNNNTLHIFEKENE